MLFFRHFLLAVLSPGRAKLCPAVLICAGLLLAAPRVAGQFVPGSIHSSSPEFSHQYSFLGDSLQYFVDTNFRSLQWYRLLNASGQDDYAYLNLSNMGAPQNALVHKLRRPGDQLLLDHGAYDRYFVSPGMVPFFQVRSPLSEGLYSQGIGRGQVFSIAHTQNITPRWNFLLRYRRMNSQGAYLNNQNKLSSFLFSTRYHSRDDRYVLKGYFADEEMALQENGGIRSDSIFEDNLESNRSAVLTRLDDDERIQRKGQVYLRHHYSLTKPGNTSTDPDSNLAVPGEKGLSADAMADSTTSKKDSGQFYSRDSTALSAADSLGNDSVLASSSTVKLLLGHTLHYQAHSMAYLGASDDFYDQYIFTNGAYRDSLSLRSLRNDFYTQFQVGDTTRLDLRVGLGNLSYRYGNQYLELQGSTWSAFGQLGGQLGADLSLQSEARIYYAGAYAGNLHLRAALQWRPSSAWNFYGRYRLQRLYPTLRDQWYVSNNFSWRRDFNPSTDNQLTYGLSYREDHQLEVSHYTGANFLYYDAQSSPRQASQGVNYTRISTTQNFRFWEFLHLDNKATYQIQYGGEEFLPLPEWVLRHSLYFEFRLFDQALKVLAGTELQYFSRFNSPSYNPALGRFFLASERPFGDYPYLDFFAQFKVGKAHLYVRYQHVNQGLSGYDYYAAPHYPRADRRLRLGLRWRFFN